MIANILEDLTKSEPDNKKYQMLLDGFYSQQLFIDQLIATIRKIEEESRLRQQTEDNAKRIITDVQTFSGDGN